MVFVASSAWGIGYYGEITVEFVCVPKILDFS